MTRLLAAALLFCAASLANAQGWERFFGPFLGDLREEVAEAKASGRTGVLVMYHFEECPYCARMKREVLALAAVQSYFGGKYVCVAIDTRGSQPITGIDGKVLPENLYARALSLRGTPTFDFYDREGARVYRHTGAMYDPQEFLMLGEFVAAGAYRSGSFAVYKQTRQGKGS